MFVTFAYEFRLWILWFAIVRCVNNLRYDLMTIFVCRVGSAHNKVTYLRDWLWGGLPIEIVNTFNMSYYQIWILGDHFALVREICKSKSISVIDLQISKWRGQWPYKDSCAWKCMLFSFTFLAKQATQV